MERIDVEKWGLARVGPGLRFAGALVATNLKASFALRGAFWLQAGFMVANNVLFFVFWWIFFDRFEEVRGWRLSDVTLLFGVVAMGFGSTVVLGGGVRELARTVVDGELDVFLTQPRSPLLQVAGSRTQASGWGDMLSGLGFIAASGLVGVAQLPLLVVAVACSATVFTASGIVLHSAAFWLGRVESLARQLWEFLVTFSTYPRTLFSGVLKLLLFTVIPAGFIGYLPAELLRGFAWWGLAATVGGAVAYALLAGAVFRAGLRRYESGNRFGVRG